MGTTFVGIDGRGFWMRDGVLELWLRLLALHLEEPGDDERSTSLALSIRNQWLLASKGWFTGAVPHDLEGVVGSREGGRVVLGAIRSLTRALEQAPPRLDRGVLDLLGVDGSWTDDVDTARLLEVSRAWVDLLEGRIEAGRGDTTFTPGSRAQPGSDPR